MIEIEANQTEDTRPTLSDLPEGSFEMCHISSVWAALVEVFKAHRDETSPIKKQKVIVDAVKPVLSKFFPDYNVTDDDALAVAFAVVSLDDD